jgi:adenylylsulfate kinase
MERCETAIPRSANTVWQHSAITRVQREFRNGHQGAVIWLTGLSGAGKSTLALGLEARLFQLGCNVYVCDGDNIRHGLCGDLGFSREDRAENIRRVSEVAKLLLDAGLIVITAFISPDRAERERARQRIPPGKFIEVYCRCPLGVCEHRDVKGLYRRARAGEIPEFTGISAPYEVPDHPEIIVDTHRSSIAACVNQVMEYLMNKALIFTDPTECNLDAGI